MSNSERYTERELARLRVEIEDALRAEWVKYANTGDWYDAVGTSAMADIAIKVLRRHVSENDATHLA